MEQPPSQDDPFARTVSIMDDSQPPSDVEFTAEVPDSQETTLSMLSSPSCNLVDSTSTVGQGDAKTVGSSGDTDAMKVEEEKQKKKTLTYEDALKEMKAKCPGAEEKWKQTLRYIQHAEESRNCCDDFFTGEVSDASDVDNMEHFLLRDAMDISKGAKGVICTSLQLQDSLAKLQEISELNGDYEAPTLFSVYQVKEEEKATSQAPFWIEFNMPPSEPRIPDDRVRGHLEHLKSKQYPHAKDVNDMLSQLTVDKKLFAKSPPPTSKFMKDVLVYRLATQWAKVYATLQRNHGNGNDATLEWVVGFGHAHIVYSKDDTNHVVNGPLFEAVVDIELDNRSKGIKIIPREDQHVSINREVIAALKFDNDFDDDVVAELYGLTKEKQAQSIVPGTKSSCHDLLTKALNLRFSTFLKTAHDERFPAEALILSHEWCLYSRNKTRTTFSTDARNLEHGISNNEIELTLPIIGLMEGADALKHVTSRLVDGNRVSLHPLPASARQMKVTKKLWNENRPVAVVKGPPGCGKTHLIVNECATALSHKKRVLFCSTNEAATRAFVDKLPKEIRPLCLNVSGLKGGDLEGFKESLQDFNKGLSDAEEHADGYEEKVKNSSEQREDLKNGAIQARKVHEDTHSKKMMLVNNINAKPLFDLASTFPTKYACLVQSALKEEKVVAWDSVPEQLAEVSFGSIHRVTEDVLALAKSKTAASSALAEATASAPEEDDVFEWPESPAPESADESTSVDNEDVLNSTTINGKKPTSEEDWKRIVRALEFRKGFIDPLLEIGLQEADVSLHYDSSFMVCLRKAKKLHELFLALGADEKETLRGCLSGPTDSRDLQDHQNELSKRIQDVENDLVLNKVLSFMTGMLDGEARSKLDDLQTDLEKFTASHICTDDAKKKKKESKMKQLVYKQFVSSFQETAGSLPFLVMTIEQVSTFLSAKHSFDFCVFDEASQSEYTALLVAARCKQLLIVGDNNQTSPSECGLSADRLAELQDHLPSIKSTATKKRLLPAQSFFDLFKNTFSRGGYVVRLQEHFRCRPDIMQVFNAVFYRNELDPLRERSNEKAVELVRVEGNRDPNTKTNSTECDCISDLALQEIIRSLKSSTFRTIGIISMGGENQRDAIKRCLEAKIDTLVREKNLPWDVVQRHRILYGVPQQCQGDERDLVFISAVHGGWASPGAKRSGPKAKKQKKKELKDFSKDDLKELCKANNIKGHSKPKEEVIELIKARFKGNEAGLEKIVEAHFSGTEESNGKSTGDDMDVEDVGSKATSDKPDPGTKKREKIQPEIKESDKKKWCVATSRGKEKLVLVHSYDKSELTNRNDIRIKVLEHVSNASNTACAYLSIRPKSGAEQALVSSLTTAGFQVCRRGGYALSKALCIRRAGFDSSSTVIVWIENCGESEIEWSNMMDKQLSLERAGRACLRVDYLCLMVNYTTTIDNLIGYLNEKLPVGAGMKRRAEGDGDSVDGEAKKPRAE